MVNDAPLTDWEQALLRRVEDQVWTPWLREQLVTTLRNRGFTVGRHDSPGELADALRALAQ